MSNSLWPHELQHIRLPCPSQAHRVYSNLCPMRRWCHPIISSSVVPFSSRLQSFPASGSFQMSQLFTSGSQSIGVSASASPLPVNIQDWFPLGLTGWTSLQSKGLSRVLLQHHSSKASILQCSALFMVQLSHLSHLTSRISYISHLQLSHLTEAQYSLIPSSSLSWNSTFYFYFSLKVSASKWQF